MISVKVIQNGKAEIKAVEIDGCVTVGDFIKKLRRQAGIRQEDTVDLIAGANPLTENMLISDVSFMANSVCHAKVKERDAVATIRGSKGIPVSREIDFIPPPLPDDQKDGYFIFCPKHKEEAQLNVNSLLSLFSIGREGRGGR